MPAPHPLTARAKARPLAVLGLVAALFASACVAGTPGTVPSPSLPLSTDPPTGPKT